MTAARACASPARSSSHLPRLDRLRARQQSAFEGGLGDGEDRSRTEPLLGQHLAEVGRDLAHHIGGNAVEHDRDGGAALARFAQQIPRDRVGVAGGGRDEDPQVCGGEQLGREIPVGRDDTVDVGRVEQGEAAAERIGRDEPDRVDARSDA